MMEWSVGHVAGSEQERDAYDEELEIAEAQVQTIVWLVAGVFVATSVVASVKLIRGHLNNFTQPIVQSKTLRSLPDLSHPWPFNKWCAPIKMGPEFIRDCKMATMQFVVLKPLMAFLAIVLEIRGVYNQGSFSVKTGYLYTSLIVNTSITYAFYYLVLFYLALGDHLKPYNPVPKFLCIKAVLFLSFWQSVVLAFLSRFQIIHEVGSWSVENVTTGIQNLLICFEMCFVALAHHHAFPYAPYIDATDDGTHASLRRNILADHLAFGDAMRDFNEVMPVVLPTQFKPGASILKGKKNLTHVAPKDLFAPENVRLLNDEHEAAEEKDPNAMKRGWKL
ncbi:putative seven transmembrane receptor-rhodopsin family, partial [Globisporangium splendens]